MAYQELFGISVPGLSRRLKGHILIFPYPCITDIAPLESQGCGICRLIDIFYSGYETTGNVKMETCDTEIEVAIK